MISIQTHIDYLEKLKLHVLFIPKQAVEAMNTQKKSRKINHRVLCYYQGELIIRGGLVAYGDGNAYLTLAKPIMKNLQLNPNHEFSIDLALDESKYGMDVPLEFEEVLKQEPEFKRRFELLTMGAQRAIIYKIAQFKFSDKRIEKSLQYLSNLIQCPENEVDFKKIYGLNSKNME